ncbi:MAG: hypothetical protein R2792_10730 [Saprospiraceae bacterium]
MKKVFLLFALLVCGQFTFASNPVQTLPVYSDLTVDSNSIPTDIHVSIEPEEEPDLCWNCATCENVLICVYCICTNTEDCADSYDKLFNLLCAAGCCYNVSPD